MPLGVRLLVGTWNAIAIAVRRLAPVARPPVATHSESRVDLRPKEPYLRGGLNRTIVTPDGSTHGAFVAGESVHEHS